MLLGHRFTSLGDARAKRFHAWSASHSMLLAISSIHPFARWNVHSFMHAVSYYAWHALSPSKPGAACLSTIANVPAAMPWPYYKELSKPQTFRKISAA
jgi:hypothetical protein